MKLAIIGSSGLTGTEVTRSALTESDVTKLILISRKTSALSDAKIEEVILKPFSKDKIVNLNINADIFICCLGTTIKKAGNKEDFYKVDHDFILAFTKLAKKQNAKACFVISARGANKNSKIFYNRIKGETEEAMRKLALDSLYILRPSLLIGDRQEPRLVESIGMFLVKALQPVLSENLRKTISTPTSNIADYILLHAKAPKPGVHIVESTEI